MLKVLVLVCAVVVAACGGGGGDAPPVAETPVPVEAAEEDGLSWLDDVEERVAPADRAVVVVPAGEQARWTAVLLMAEARGEACWDGNTNLLSVVPVCPPGGCGYGSWKAYGTAFHVGGGEWLTAAHVAEVAEARDGGRVSLGVLGSVSEMVPGVMWDIEGRAYSNPAFELDDEGMIPWSMLRHDYGIIRTGYVPEWSLRLAARAPYVGQQLSVLGWPGTDFGRRSLVEVLGTDEGAVQYSDSLAGGSSGGVLADECGLVYGVHVSVSLETGHGSGPQAWLLDWRP